MIPRTIDALRAAYPAALSAGEVLRRERERRGLGLREVARMLGTSPTALSELERGHFRPGAPLVTALAEHYRLDVWEILQARDLVPLDCRARFVCARCEGTGVPGHLVDTACLDCDGGHRPHPPTVAALASWASLGWRATDDGHPGIAGAEEWAREMVGVREVWWRVGPVEASGVVLGPAHPGLARAGLGWSWSGRRPDGVTLTVPPLGSAR